MAFIDIFQLIIKTRNQNIKFKSDTCIHLYMYKSIKSYKRENSSRVHKCSFFVRQRTNMTKRVQNEIFASPKNNFLFLHLLNLCFFFFVASFQSISYGSITENPSHSYFAPLSCLSWLYTTLIDSNIFNKIHCLVRVSWKYPWCKAFGETLWNRILI